MKHQARLKPSLELNRASTSLPIAVVLEAKLQWAAIRLGQFVHHRFDDPAGTNSVTASRNHGGSNQSLVLVALAAMGDRDRPAVENDEHNRPNMPPHSIATTSLRNTTQRHCTSPQKSSAHHPHLQNYEGPTVLDEAVFDTDGPSTPMDLNHAVTVSSVLQESEGTTVPDEAVFDADEFMSLDPNHAATSCEEGSDWYYVSRAVLAAAAATSQHTAESASHSDFESELLAATMIEDYIDWPDEDSE
ncbi:hypothetical protein EDD22DRAFT_850026 [Suillus occidentalis]|nr:hypothetical protein EDD22DRAFT_850026 [Suillus occidentalis]